MKKLTLVAIVAFAVLVAGCSRSTPAQPAESAQATVPAPSQPAPQVMAPAAPAPAFPSEAAAAPPLLSSKRLLIKGLGIGMSKSEVDSAIAALGLTERETGSAGSQIEIVRNAPECLQASSDNCSRGKLTFEGDRLSEFSLDIKLFTSRYMTVGDFAQEVANAYPVEHLQDEAPHRGGALDPYRNYKGTADTGETVSVNGNVMLGSRVTVSGGPNSSDRFN